MYPTSPIRFIRLPILALLLVWHLTACRRGGVSPDGSDPDALTLKAQQNELLNSPFLAVGLSGTYRAVVIDWERFNTSDYKSEGTLTYGPPDTNFIKSRYYLQVAPTVGKDSIQLTFWGDGYGGIIDKRNVGPFKVTQTIPRTIRGYTLDSWQFGVSADPNQIHVSRLAYSNKTELSLGMTLCRVIDKSRADYGKIVMKIQGQLGPTDVPRTMQPWGHFTFTRRSTGVLENR